jgi:hypothetical protein
MLHRTLQIETLKVFTKMGCSIKDKKGENRRSDKRGERDGLWN